MKKLRGLESSVPVVPGARDAGEPVVEADGDAAGRDGVGDDVAVGG